MRTASAQTRQVTLSAGCIFVLPLSFLFLSYRLCYLILHPCEAVWCQREEQHLLWSGGVCAVHCQMFSAFHHLQQSPLCLPEALEIRQPKVICEGISFILRCYFVGFWCRNAGILHVLPLWRFLANFQPVYFRFAVCVCPKARNIAVCIEFRDSDEEEAVALKVKCMQENMRKNPPRIILSVQELMGYCCCFSVHLRPAWRTLVYQKCLCLRVTSPAKSWILRWSKHTLPNL